MGGDRSQLSDHVIAGANAGSLLLSSVLIVIILTTHTSYSHISPDNKSCRTTPRIITGDFFPSALRQ